MAVSRRAAPSMPEVGYVLRTLLRTAGYSWTLQWAETGNEYDIAYGNEPELRARVRIPQVAWPFDRASSLEPVGVVRFHDVVIPRFPDDRPAMADAGPAGLTFPTDVLFACYWWLTGAREPSYPRDRVDNLHIGRDSIVRQEQLLSQPCVSLAAALLRQEFESAGLAARHPRWSAGSRRYAFSFTHDVDYPEIIRWIEVPRVLASRKAGAWRLALDVATGRSHFWTFDEWVELAASRGTQPAFYFMARRGSLVQYAFGTPDDFYDVTSARFRRLIADLRARGCEIGLHASFRAHRSRDVLGAERQTIERVAGVNGIGNRHHYWHLDPADPNETLLRHQEAGLAYDSSLGLEYYPGFRRGICHPFRPFHPASRRELDIVQLPPAWMDDHFDRRLAQNEVANPDEAARRLLDVAAATGGAIVVDYHSRGMNAGFYPRYGPWLTRFLEQHVGDEATFATPLSVVDQYRAHVRELESVSEDRLGPDTAIVADSHSACRIAPLTSAEVPATAALHIELFGDPLINGYSVATLGPDLLANVFYRLNLDNPGFHCDVARVDGKVVAFSLYTTDRSRVFLHPLRRHPVRLISTTLGAVVKRPAALRILLKNLAYVSGERTTFLDGVDGWWIVAGVDPAYRTPEIERRTGGPIAALLFDRMEARFREVGCRSWYGVVRPDNVAINKFLQRRGAIEVGHGQAQGLTMRYYVKRLST